MNIRKYEKVMTRYTITNSNLFSEYLLNYLIINAVYRYLNKCI